MGQGNPNILIIEDEPSQSELLSYNLSLEGYDVLTAETGEEALLMVKENDFDLILLDWMLPQVSGLEVCRQIKRGKNSKYIPIIMLTARGEEEDKVRGLDTGADDFVVKPYSIKELLARVRSNLRVRSENKNVEVLTFQDIKMDIVRHTVGVADTTISLGPIEFKLLRVFLETPRRVFSREQLLQKVWDSHADVETRTVDVHIGRLRKQLDVHENAQKYIRTIRGFGYSLDWG